jgi:hypothetical protein
MDYIYGYLFSSCTVHLSVNKPKYSNVIDWLIDTHIVKFPPSEWVDVTHRVSTRFNWTKFVC